MRLFVINPDSGLSNIQLEQRVNTLKVYSRESTEIVMECLERTEVCIDSLCDASIAAPEIIQKAIFAEKQGYDAVALYCLSDPGIEACREAVDIPIVGGGQSSLQIAAGLGYGFSILTTSESRIYEKMRFVRNSCIDSSLLVSVRSVDFDILASRDIDKKEIEERLYDSVAKCIKEDGAQVVVLGCLSFAGMGPILSERMGIPVIDPALILVSMAEMLISQKLTHSKRAFPKPPLRKRSWEGGSFEIGER